MPTFEVRCVECGDKKWPTLPERPEKYTCALCNAVEPAQREIRRKAGQDRARITNTRRRRPGTSPEAS